MLEGISYPRRLYQNDGEAVHVLLSFSLKNMGQVLLIPYSFVGDLEPTVKYYPSTGFWLNRKTF